MYKIILFLFLSLSILNAGLINAIAIKVNNDIITLSDIDNKMQNENLSNQEAIDKLIDEILYKQLIKKHSIYIDILDINNYLELLAKENKIKVYELKNAIKQQQDYNEFERGVKKQLKHEKLIQTISNGKINRANNEDLKIYYNNNKNEFKKASKIDLKVYVSKNKKALQSIQNNPMSINSDVDIQDITLEDKNLNSKIRYIISKTKQNKFSSIFVNNKAYNMIYIIKKYDVQITNFKNAKNEIFELLMKKRQNQFLKNYFETLKIKANIKVLR